MKHRDPKKRKMYLFPMLLAAILAFAGPGAAQVQQGTVTVSGTVVDEQKQPMIGVTIAVPGTTSGTTTGIDGKFALSNVAPDATVRISFVGYETVEFKANSLLDRTVTLAEEANAIDQVVVVGYGVQKKVNLTGAVSSINMDEMTEGRPATRISTALSGLSPGLYIQQSTGRPNADGAGTILLRGMGSLNPDATSSGTSKSAPFVVIDGMISTIEDMNNLNPNDVESISLLKDAASSSIYGSRAANGVILVTTKHAKSGRFTVNYNGYAAWGKPTNTLDLVSDYADYMRYFNDGLRNSGASPIYGEKTIKMWLDPVNRLDKYKYPNTDWFEELFQTQVVTNHTLSFSGGTERLKASGSFGYLNNPGIMENSTFEQYNARLTVTADVKKWLTLGMNVKGNYGDAEMGSRNIGDVFSSIPVPGIVARHPSGRYGGPEANEEVQTQVTPFYTLNATAGSIVTRGVSSRFFGTIKLMEGLSVEGSFNYNYATTVQNSTSNYADIWSFRKETILRSTEATNKTFAQGQLSERTDLMADVIARYGKTFFKDRLRFDALLGASQEKHMSSGFLAKREDLIADNLTSINAATGDQTASGTTDMGHVMHSYFGRVNFAFDDKYLLEANLRLDRSSKFAPGKYRDGWFPSVSVGWRIEQEEFMKNIGWLNGLKLRASYGGLGNNGAIGNYEWQSLYTKAPYVLNNGVVDGMSFTLANGIVQWEETYITNLAVDFQLFRNRLDGTAEYFYKDTKNILARMPKKAHAGSITTPVENSAQVTNSGLELSLNWRDKIGDFSYHVGGNYTIIKNNVKKFRGDERVFSGANMVTEGYPINVQYVYAIDRLVRTDDDVAYVQQMIDQAPYDSDGNKMNPFSGLGSGAGRPEKGDFLYRDTNGDGIINDDDKIAVGHGLVPPIVYGFNLGGSWKGIDFSVMFQGVAKLKVLWNDRYNTGFHNVGQPILKRLAENAYREDDSYFGGTNIDTDYPRLNTRNNEMNNKPNEFFIENKSYLRIKNIQLGYTLPKKWVEKLDISNVRVYGSLENYFTFTKYRGIDPEVSGTTYPPLKQATVGISVTF